MALPLALLKESKPRAKKIIGGMMRYRFTAATTLALSFAAFMAGCHHASPRVSETSPTTAANRIGADASSGPLASAAQSSHPGTVLPPPVLGQRVTRDSAEERINSVTELLSALPEHTNSLPVAEVDASALALEYEGDRDKADKAYKGRVLVVLGNIRTIGPNQFVFVVLFTGMGARYPGDDANGIRCEFSDAKETFGLSSTLSAGDKVRIEGICVGKSDTTIRLSHSVLVTQSTDGHFGS